MFARRALQDNDRFGGTFSRKQGSHQVEIVMVAGEWIDPHRPFDPRYGRLRIAKEGQVDSALHDEARIVGIERQRSFQMVFALSEMPLHQRKAAHNAVTFRIVLVEMSRGFHKPIDFAEKLRGPGPKFVSPRLAKGAGLP